MALSDNLQLWYDPTDTSGTTMHDSTAGAHNATLNTNASFSSGWLVTASSVSTVGGADIGQISALDYTSYPLSSTVVFQTSCNTIQSNGNMKIGFNNELGSSPYSQFSVVMEMNASQKGNLTFRYRDSSGNDNVATTSATYNDNSPHQCTFTISSSGAAKGYVDGTQVVTFTASGSLSTSKWHTIGNDDRSTPSASSVFVGKIKYIGFWNRELTSTEVSSLYNSGSYMNYAALTGGGSPTAPTVTSSSVTSIGSTTATGNGNVTADGGATITERGVVVSTSANPTTADSKFTASGTTGPITASITGLTASTAYHCRAYAINSVGTSYGSDQSFTTTSSGGSVTITPASTTTLGSVTVDTIVINYH